MKIGIDVDGVILDYMNMVRAYADLYDYCDLHKNGVINQKGIKLKERYDWTVEEMSYFADHYFVDLTAKTNFNPLSIEIMKRLKDEGHKLYIISNRGILHKEASNIAQKMIENAGVSIDKYFWEISEKTKVCLDNNIDIMVDDSPNVCEDAVENGIYAIYFREKDSPILESNLLYDVDNWGQVYRSIKEIEKKQAQES